MNDMMFWTIPLSVEALRDGRVLYHNGRPVEARASHLRRSIGFFADCGLAMDACEDAVRARL